MRVEKIKRHRDLITASAAAMLALGLALAFAPAANAQDWKVPGTKSGYIITPDRVKIHYLEAGKASSNRTILFIPGWTMPAQIWEHQIVHFAKTHRVVAMDPRSQGLSSQTSEGLYPAARARDIRAVVDQLKLAPVVLVGWSMGVTEIASYVDQFGTSTVAGLVLVDGIAGSDYDPKWTPMLLGWASSFLKDREKAADEFLRSMYKKPQTEDYHQRVIRASLRTPTNTAVALLIGSFTTDNRPALAKINEPTLIVCAPEPPYVAFYEDMQRRIAGSRLEKFEGAGHALFVDERERFNSVLAEFIKTLGAGR